MKTRLIRSADELRRLAPAWNRLLSKSDVSFPTLRADVLALWLKHFGLEDGFSAIVVEDRSEVVAALPLLRQKRMRVLPTLSLARNDWAETGDLLMDRDADRESVASELAAEINRLNVPLLWMDDVRFDTPAWRSLIGAMQRRHLKSNTELKHYVGLIDTDDQWEAYEKRLSSNHRKKSRKADRLASSRGQLEYVSLRNLSETQVRAALQECFEIENLGWKSESGTSVMATEGMFEFYVATAQILARDRALEILNLRLDGQLIAFEMGYVGHDTYYSFKVGYDEEYAKLSPGQLLMYHQIQSYSQDADRNWIDAVATISDATCKWATHCLPRGRVMLSTGWVGNQVISAYEACAPRYRKLRNRDSGVELPKLGPGPKQDALEVAEATVTR